MHILVADDVPGMRQSLHAALTEAGHSVALCGSGKAALEEMSRRPAEVLIADLWMPNGDGLQLIKQIRIRWPEARIVAITGGGPKLTIETASSLAEVWGAERVFIKPFDENELIEFLTQLQSNSVSSSGSTP